MTYSWILNPRSTVPAPILARGHRSDPDLDRESLMIPPTTQSLLAAVEAAATIGRLAGELYRARLERADLTTNEDLLDRAEEAEAVVEDYSWDTLAIALHKALCDMGHRDLPYEVQPSTEMAAIDDLAYRATAYLDEWAKRARTERQAARVRRDRNKIAERT
jgi:hypothetical protein